MKNSIYKITNPEGKIYIGQANDTDKRFYTYSNLNCKGQTKLYASFLKHGVDNHAFEVLECDINRELLNTRERFFQDKFNAIDNGNLNGLLVSTPTKKRSYSKETLLKMSSTHKGKIVSEETKAKLSLTSKGNKNALGHKHSAETISKMSVSKKGNISKSAPIMYNGKIYSSSKEVASVLGCSRAGVCSMLKGRYANKYNLQYI